MLSTIYGVNGVGKDVVAEKLHQENKNVIITSTPRLLMYAFDLIDSYRVDEPVSKEHYQKLDSINQKEIDRIDATICRRILEDFANDKDNYYILLSHLVPALNLYSNDVKYLTDKIVEEYYVELNKVIIQLVAPIELILERRLRDLKDRKRPVSIEQIAYHQSLCDIEWERIKRVILENSYSCSAEIVPNIELGTTVNDVKKLILTKNNLGGQDEGRQRIRY